MEGLKRGECAEKFKLCMFRVLRRGSPRAESRLCGLDSNQKVHYRLLHSMLYS